MKAPRSARATDWPAPAGAPVLPGHPDSGMTQTTDQEAAFTTG